MVNFNTNIINQMVNSKIFIHFLPKKILRKKKTSQPINYDAYIMC
jgi:hypothetical protein